MAYAAAAPVSAASTTTVNGTVVVEDMAAGFEGATADVQLYGWDDSTGQWQFVDAAYADSDPSDASWQLTVPSDAAYDRFALTAYSELTGYETAPDGPSATLPDNGSSAGTFSVTAGQANDRGAIDLVAEDGTRWVTGTAEGPGGAPLTSVSVDFAGWAGEGTPQWPGAGSDWNDYQAYAYGDRNGSFVAPIAAGTYHLTYTSNDCLAPLDASDLLAVPGGSAEVADPIEVPAVTLQNGHKCVTLGGTLSVTGHAVPDDTWATLYRWDDSEDQPGWTWADEAPVATDGTYSFQPQVPQDADDHYTVEFSLPYSDSDVWLGGGDEPITPDAEGTTVAVAPADADQTIQLPDTAVSLKPVNISGQVYDYGDSGYTVTGSVSLYQWNGTAFAQVGEPQSVTESQPYFSFPGQDPTQSYYLTFHSTVPGAEDQYSNNAPAVPTSPNDEAAFYGYWYQQDGTEIDLEARAPWRRLSGTVTNENGDPLAEIPVAASIPNRTTMTTTDESGHWTLDVVAGSQKIEYAADDATCFGSVATSQEVSLTLPRATPLDEGVQKLAPDVTCTTLTGTVSAVDSDDNGYQYVALYHLATHHEDDGDYSYDYTTADWQRGTSADEDGSYSFRYARPGQRYVIHTEDERTTAGGVPIEWVANLGADQWRRSFYDAPGFTLPSDAGDTYELPDLVLEPTATAEGTATLADGTSPAYWVEALRWSPGDQDFEYADMSFSSEADGTFTVTGLPAGTYTLEFDPQNTGGFDATYLGGGDTEPTGPNDAGHVFTVTNGDIGAAIKVGSTTLRPVSAQQPPAPTGTLAGTVQTASDHSPVAGAYVTACAADGSGLCRYAQVGDDGSYELDGLPVGDYMLDVASPDPATLFGASGKATVLDGDTATENFTLAAPVKAPESAKVTLVNAPTDNGGATPPAEQPTSFGGVPSFYYDDPVDFSISGCAGTYGDLDGDGDADTAPAYQIKRTDGTVIKSGSLTAGAATDGVAAFTAELGKLYPNHGGATISTNILASCSDAAPIAFDVFIDPSGVVTDQYGRTLSGASVTLLQGSGDSYTPVPNDNQGLGSPVMSPANTANPTTTDGSGYFRWDVAPGSYEIQASKTGCTTATSGPMSVPPLQIDLVVPLDCTAASAPVADGAPSIVGDGTVGSVLSLSADDVTWPAPLASDGVVLYRDYGTADAEVVDECEGQNPCLYEVTADDAGHDLTAVAVGQRPDYMSPTGLVATFASVEQAGDTVHAMATTPPPSGGGDTGTTPPPSTGGDTGTTPPPSTGGDTGTTPPPSSGGSKPTVKGSTGISGHVVPGHKLTAKLPTFKGLPAKAHKQVVWFVNGKKVGTGRHLKVKAAWVGKKVVAKVTATWTEKVNGLKVTKHLSRASKPVRVRRG